MKKLLLTSALIVCFVLTFGQSVPPPEDPPHEPDAIFWGHTYSNISEMYNYGYGRCYIEATAKYWVFWTKVSETTKYHEMDCSTSIPIGDWVDTM